MNTGIELIEKFGECVTVEELLQASIDGQSTIDVLRADPDQTFYLWARNAYGYHKRQIENA